MLGLRGGVGCGDNMASQPLLRYRIYIYNIFIVDNLFVPSFELINGFYTFSKDTFNHHSSTSKIKLFPCEFCVLLTLKRCKKKQ